MADLKNHAIFRQGRITKDDLLFYVINLISALIIGTGQSGALWGIILIILSIPLLRRPETILPTLFVSSWSISFAVWFIAAYFYYASLFLIAILLNKRSIYIIKKRHPAFRYAILFILWITAMGFLSISGDKYIPIKIGLYIVPMVLCSNIFIKRLDFTRRAFLINAITFSTFFLFTILLSPYHFTIEGKYFSRTSVTIIHDLNPNNAAQIVLLLYLILFCYFVPRKKFLRMSVALFNLITLFFLGSRTSFYSLIAATAIYFIFILKQKKRTKLVLLICITLLVYFAIQIGYSAENFTRLNYHSIAEDEGNGRFINWYNFFQSIVPHYWLTGIGVGSENYKSLGFLFDADNMYIDLLCETGILGLILFLLMYSKIISTNIKVVISDKRYHFCFIYLITFLVVGLGESVFDSPLIWFLLMYYILSHNEIIYKKAPQLAIKRSKIQPKLHLKHASITKSIN